MKNHFKRLEGRECWSRKLCTTYVEPEGRYKLRWGGYHRYFRTYNEYRQNLLHAHEGLPVRTRRLNLPVLYDDLNIVRNWGRSWKDYTKNRKQWERRNGR
jgi:hypothetical protein